MSKLELHKGESFEFGNLCPESKCSNGNGAEATSIVGVVEPELPAQETGPEAGKQEDNVPGVEVIHAEDQTAGVVEPVLPVHETGPESGKQEENVPGVDVIHVEAQTVGIVEPVLPVHETDWESCNQGNVPVLEITHVEDQSITKPVGKNR